MLTPSLLTPRQLEAVARAIYEQNPCGDQETDLDGRPTGPGYLITWETLREYDAGLHRHTLDQALAAIAALPPEWLALIGAAKEFNEAEDAFFAARINAFEVLKALDRCEVAEEALHAKAIALARSTKETTDAAE